MASVKVRASGLVIGLALVMATLSACGHPTAAKTGTSDDTAARSSSVPLPDRSTPPSSQPSSQSAEQPILGRFPSLDQKGQIGFGEVRPDHIHYGGDPTGNLRDITWQTWGGPQALGTGLGWWVPPDKAVGEGEEAPINLVAFELGNCDGRLVYRNLAVYFPTHGGSFDPATDNETQPELCPPNLSGSRLLLLEGFVPCFGRPGLGGGSSDSKLLWMRLGIERSLLALESSL
jgi:hypothetical protein